MSKTVKMIALVTAMVLVVGIIATIDIVTSENKSSNTPSASSQQTAPPADPALTVDGEKVEDPGVILTIDGEEISFEEYRYYYLKQKMNYTYSDPAYFDDDADGAKAAALKEDVDSNLKEMGALLQLGKEKGIALTDVEKSEISTSLEQTKASLGDQFETQLKASLLIDEAFFLKMSEKQMLLNKIQKAVQEEGLTPLRSEILEGVISAKHILIPFDAAKDATEEDTAKAEKAAEEKANSLLEEIRASSNQTEMFETLFAEYKTNDPSQPDEGYTFAEGKMVDEFYMAALGLKQGEVSEPVKTSFGYHIILRLPLNEKYVDENLASLASQELVTTIIDEALAPVEKKQNVVFGKYYDAITPTSVE